MNTNTTIVLLLLLATTSTLLHAQASDTILPNPQAAQLRKVWQVTGRPLHHDKVGYQAARLPDLTGDSINEFAVQFLEEFGGLRLYKGAAPQPDLIPYAAIDSIADLPLAGRFDGTDSIRLIAMRYHWEYPNNVPKLYSTPYQYDCSAEGLSQRTAIGSKRLCFRFLRAADLNNDDTLDLCIVSGCENTLTEIAICKGGREFQVEEPTVIIRDSSAEQGSLNVSFVHLDGDQKLDMVIGARQAGGPRLKFYFSDDNSPYSWATRPPDREILLYPTTNIYLDFVFIPIDLDGDHHADFVGKVYPTTGPPAAIYLFLSASGKDYRTRPFTLDDADRILPTRSDAYLWRAAGYLNDSSQRFEMLPLVQQLDDGDGMILLSGGPNGPNHTYDAYFFSPSDGIIGRAMSPLGDVTGDAWPDMITGDERWGAFVDQGIAIVLAGGPYIPTDDPTVDVQQLPAEGKPNAISFWPNPVRDRLTIAWRGDLHPMPHRFELHDINGRYIAGGSADPSVGSVVWNRGQTPSGAYILTTLAADDTVIASASILLQ